MDSSKGGTRRTWCHGAARILVLALAAALLGTSCSAPPPPKTSGTQLYKALFKDTGYQLGDDVPAGNSRSGECAAESRYGNTETGPVALLVCTGKSGDGSGRVKYRVNYTPPEAGHRIWKIAATFPDKSLQDIDFIKSFEEKYGTPRKVVNPFALTWQWEDAYLELSEDQYGVHLQLWDRSLR
ncbi:MAG: hypothetical protein K9G33_02410 [Sneathiella sp.]|nr:hypothetical protein [Sneathiella sp.]